MLLSKIQAMSQNLSKIFEEFCRKMHLKWHFHNEPTPEFSTVHDFHPTSMWKPPNNIPSLEHEKYLFEISKTILGYSNFSKEEFQSLCSLDDGRNIVIKKLIRVCVW